MRNGWWNLLFKRGIWEIACKFIPVEKSEICSLQQIVKFAVQHGEIENDFQLYSITDLE